MLFKQRCRRIQTAVILLILFSSGFGFSDSFGPEGISGLGDRELELLLKREILLFTAPDLIEAAVIFNRDVAATWAVIAATEDQWKYVKELSEVQVNRRTGTFTFETHVIDTLAFHTEYDVIIEADHHNLCLKWRLDPGRISNDVIRLEGYWQLYAFGPDKTLGRYGTSVLLGNVPEVLQKLFRRGGVKRSLLSLKKYVETHGNS